MGVITLFSTLNRLKPGLKALCRLRRRLNFVVFTRNA